MVVNTLSILMRQGRYTGGAITQMRSDIPRCPYCGLRMIAEEVSTHQCKPTITDYKIKGDVLWLYDGTNWYPRKLL